MRPCNPSAPGPCRSGAPAGPTSPLRETTIDSIAQLLSHKETAGHVLDFLRADANRHLVKKNIPDDGFGYNVEDLHYRLECFVTAGVEHDLLKAAAAKSLRNDGNPDFARKMCEALIKLALFRPEQPLDSWVELKRTFEIDWVTDSLALEGLDRLNGSAKACELTVGPAKGLPNAQSDLQKTSHTLRLDTTDAAIWRAWADDVRARSDLPMVVRGPVAGALPIQALTNFLLQFTSTPVCVPHVELHEITINDPTLSTALAQFLGACSTTSLILRDCHKELAIRLIVGHHWQALHIDNATDVIRPILDGRTRARHLTLRMNYLAPSWSDQQASMESVVGSCIGLQSVLIDCTCANFMSMARALHRNSSVTAIECGLTARDNAESEAAVRLLRQNTSIQTINLFDADIPPPPGDDEYSGNNIEERVNAVHLSAALDVAQRNQWLDPLQTATSTGKGFGLSLGRVMNLGEALVDFGGRMGPLLDPASVRALRLVDRTTHFGSRRAWEEGVSRLSAHLLPMEPVLSNPSDSVPREALLASVDSLRNNGVPVAAIGEAIGRNLRGCISPHAHHSSLAGSRHREAREEQVLILSLEALAYAGVIPPRRWLREGLGMDVPDA